MPRPECFLFAFSPLNPPLAASIGSNPDEMFPGTYTRLLLARFPWTPTPAYCLPKLVVFHFVLPRLFFPLLCIHTAIQDLICASAAFVPTGVPASVLRCHNLAKFFCDTLPDLSLPGPPSRPSRHLQNSWFVNSFSRC